jgi:hypothetical protein
MIIFSLCIAAYRRYKQTLSSLETPPTIIRDLVEHSNAARPSFRECETFKTAACGKEPLRLLVARSLSVKNCFSKVSTILPICEPSGARR